MAHFWSKVRASARVSHLALGDSLVALFELDSLKDAVQMLQTHEVDNQ
jgi:hypothetical protein